jgi:ribosome recycling factor
MFFERGAIMINDIINETRSKMKSSLAVFEEDLQGIRGGRASTALVDRLLVEYYDQQIELRQLATISTPEPMQILIRPFDKGSVRAIERSIQQSNIGINPNVDGENIRLNMPPLTRERRQELVKLLHRRMEDGRVAIRNIRRGANDDLKDFEKEGLISEDELERGQEEVQKLTDQFIEQIEELGKRKEQDIMQV